MTEFQFKQLALSMVDDIEKVYGPVHYENGVKFDLSEYRRLIGRTTVMFETKKIENIHIVRDSAGIESRVLELVDAVNYFPAKEQIELFQTVWAQKYADKKWDELKLMIHHEFVPYFVKEADRRHKYSAFVEEIYEKKISLGDLKPGFYKVMNMGDPLYETLNEFYWYYVNYDKKENILVLDMVENPLAEMWCPVCYASPAMRVPLNQVTPALATISDKNIILNLAKLFGEGAATFQGKPYVRLLNQRSFGIGYMDSKYSGTLEEFVKKKDIESKAVFFSRIENLGPVEWKANKGFPVFFYQLEAEHSNCDIIKKNVTRELMEACHLPSVPLDRSYCKVENIRFYDLKQSVGAELYKTHKCAILGKMSPPFKPMFHEWSAQNIINLTLTWYRYAEIHRQNGN